MKLDFRGGYQKMVNMDWRSDQCEMSSKKSLPPKSHPGKKLVKEQIYVKLWNNYLLPYHEIHDPGNEGMAI